MLAPRTRLLRRLSGRAEAIEHGSIRSSRAISRGSSRILRGRQPARSKAGTLPETTTPQATARWPISCSRCSFPGTANPRNARRLSTNSISRMAIESLCEQAMSAF